MSNYAYLVVNRTGQPMASLEQVGEEDRLSHGIDWTPLAWLALFSDEDIIVLDESRRLTLMTERGQAIKRLARPARVFGTLFEPPVIEHLEVLENTLRRAEGSHVQALIHELSLDLTEKTKSTLEWALQTVAGRDRKQWRKLLSWVQAKPGAGWDPAEHGQAPTATLASRDLGVNALVGWIRGERVPELGSIIGPQSLPTSRSAISYAATQHFEAGDLIQHPTFGLGRVTIAHPDKIAVEFPVGSKTLIHARPG